MSISRTKVGIFGVSAVIVSAFALANKPSEKDFAITDCNVTAREAANNFRAVRGPGPSPEYATIENERKACVRDVTLKFE